MTQIADEKEGISLDKSSLKEYPSGKAGGSLPVKIGRFRQDGIEGDYCRMPLHSGCVELFVKKSPLLQAVAKNEENGKLIAQTDYLCDGISRTTTPERDNFRMLYPLSVYRQRLDNVRRKLEKEGLDALLVTDLHDIVYLCGHQTEGGSFVAMLITINSPPLLIGRYLELGDARLLNGSNAYENTTITEWWCIEDHADPVEGIRLALEEQKLEGAKIGFEYRGLSKGDEVDQYKKIKGIRDCDGKIEPMKNPPLGKFRLVDAPKFVESFRLIKSEEQVEKIRKAGSYAEIGIKAGIDAIRPGATDRQIIAHIIYAMMMKGSRQPAYGPFVSIGPASARGHSTGNGDAVKAGDLVCIEVGGSYERMHCASMQMCYVGKKLPRWLQEAETLLEEIFKTVLPKMRPGVPASEIHKEVNRIYAKSSFWYARYARASYNIGGKAFPQDWSDGGFSCVIGNDTPLQKGLVQHFIPWASTPFGAYFKSVTVHVTEEGAEPLMNYSTKVHMIDA